MKSNKILISLALTMGLALSSYPAVHAASQSKVNVQYTSRFVSEFPQLTHDVIFENGRIFLPIRELATMLQLHVQWDQKQKAATFIQPGKELIISTKTKKVQSNGKTYTLDTPLKIHNSRIYVPVRFVAEWFNGEAVWDEKTRTVVIKDNSPFISASVDQEMYWFDLSKGELYRSIGGQTPVKLGSFKVPDGVGAAPTFTSIEAEKMSGSNRWLSIHLVVHGFTGIYVVHGVFLKDGQELHHAELEYSGIYSLVHMSRYDRYAVLSDGIQVQIVDAEGEIVKELDLQALTGVDDRLMIEKVTDRYMLVRPFKTPYLILVDLIKQEGVKLYQQFYSEEDQLASENVGYNSYEFLHYFDLHLEKEEGNTLYFTSRSIETGEIQTYTYTIGK
ncbi:copper amine oxidase family protein [Thermobacillus composti KWC4]|uniref:Copper amine oxidase family protein n=1 Tax=Thermobacillus composti (strain DSM 18247 / JCM 13945 / KWC4) TaxID=717605 RepID=L0EB66_THECK|nr:copper amine oxidase N-terminal domain-containing protein [Thermobacillus composti]AGA57513.1 copper amine oxidase family protein [Thermobacillus composti KWC4]